MTVLLDTLFRRRGLATRHAPDVIDQLAASFPQTACCCCMAPGRR